MVRSKAARPFFASGPRAADATGQGRGGIASLDRLLLLILGPIWLVCAGVFVHQVLHGGVVWPGVLVASPAAPDSYPLVVGYWPGMEPEGHGLRVGDHVVRVGTVELAGVNAVGFFADVLELRGTAHSVPVEYRRAGVTGTAELELAVFPVPWWLYLLLPFTFAVLAVVVALRAPPFGEARAVVLAYLSISFFFLPFPGGPKLQTFAYLIVNFLSSLVVLPLSIRSFLLFPEEVAPRSRWVRGAPWAFAVFPVLLASWWFGMPLAHDVGYRGSMLTSAAFVLTMMTVCIVAYRRGSPVARRKMRWRLYGVYLGMTPILCTALLAVLYPELQQVVRLIFLSCIALVAVPIGLTIAIVRYNVLDIDRLISATASYSILTVLAVAAALTLVPRAASALSGAIGVEQTVGQVTLSCLVAGLLVPIHRRLRPQIDRVFFAQRYAVEQGMQRLLAELSEGGDPHALLTLAASRVDALLQPESTVLYVRRGDTYEPMFARGDTPEAVLSVSGPFVAALKQRGRPLCSDTGAAPWMESAGDPFDRAALELLHAVVIAPVRSDSDLVAFLSLGAKRSKDVYTGTDVSWLTAIADKVSGELLRRDYAERIERERAMRQSLRRYVPDAIADQLDTGAELATSEREVCVFFVDLRGYTQYSEGRGAEEIFSTVNRYTEAVSEIIHRHGGTVVEFAGDGMMAVFGAPQALAGKERAAVEAGYQIVGTVASLAQPGAPALKVGVGIATGLAFAGNVRSRDRLIWTVIGNTPNLAARLQVLTKELKVDMVIDATTWRGAGAAAAAFRCRPATPIRGRSAPEDVYMLAVGGYPD